MEQDNIRLVELKQENRQEAMTLAALAAEIWTEHYTPIIGLEQVQYMLEKFQSADRILEDIERNSYRYFIVYDNSDAVAYCAIKPDHTLQGLFLSKFYVKKNCRGRGVSRMMLDRMIALAKEKNLNHIWLTVNKNNADSIRIYHKLGFETTEELVTDIGNGFVMDDFKLRLTLT